MIDLCKKEIFETVVFRVQSGKLSRGQNTPFFGTKHVFSDKKEI